MKEWVCSVCGYVHTGDEAPDQCPQCKAAKDKFKLKEEGKGYADEQDVRKNNSVQTCCNRTERI